MRIGVLNTAFVGDLVLMGKLIDALSLEGHEVVLFSNSAGCSLYALDNRIHKCVVVKKAGGLKKIRSIFGISEQIRSEKIDYLIVAHKSWTSGMIGLLSGVQARVTFPDSPCAWLLGSVQPSKSSSHESDRYLSLAQNCVGARVFESAKLQIQGDIRLTRFLGSYPDFFADSGSPFFVCSPGSVWETKKYPPNLLASALVRILCKRRDLRCVLSGGPTDSQTIQNVLDCLSQQQEFALIAERIIDARSCLPLTELIELTRRAQFVLTPDSAPLHIASATGTPTFAFFGPTSSSTGFGPLASRSQILDYKHLRGQTLDCQPCSKHGHRVCPRVHHRCLADLPPDAVAVRVLEFGAVKS